VPGYKHDQQDILRFMLDIYGLSAAESRKVSWLYRHCGIESRYSVVPDYSLAVQERLLYLSPEGTALSPSLEKRMEWYERYATPLAIDAIKDCLQTVAKDSLTHLITVSCTGMSAPGLDISIMQQMALPADLDRTSVNFMGCYGVLHGLKMADRICRSDPAAKVLVISVELCTLHLQLDYTTDNVASGLLFGDGSAAALVVGDANRQKGIGISGFFSEVALPGKQDMSWDLSGNGFLMRLSPCIPDFIAARVKGLICRSLKKICLQPEDVSLWAFHPGGKKILDEIRRVLQLEEGALVHSYEVLRKYGNMSSATILFVLNEMMQDRGGEEGKNIFVAAFGPGLTFETAVLRS
jgi:predicted naringenin-chalcone synthase